MKVSSRRHDQRFRDGKSAGLVMRKKEQQEQRLTNGSKPSVFSKIGGLEDPVQVCRIGGEVREVIGVMGGRSYKAVQGLAFMMREMRSQCPNRSRGTA